MRKERRKKKLTPRLCSIGEYSVRTEKKTTSAQKHIYHKHMTCNRGNISSSGKQPSGPADIYYGAGRRPARQVAVQSVRRQLIGEGSNVCNGGRSKRVFTAALFQGSLSCMTLAKPAGTGEPEKIRLNFVVSFGANSCIPFTALFSLSILVSEIINFHLQSRKFQHDGIRIPVYSLSLIADRSSHGFNQNGQPCETLDSCSRLPNFPITQGKA